MTDVICNWPYASKPIIQYDHTGTTLQLWVIFRHPMDISVTPPLATWIIRVNGVLKTPIAGVWLDPYTLTLVVITIPAYPYAVTVKYDGPDEGLRISWQKQFEPFGPITGIAMPYNWQNVLDVDVPNERVTINGVLALTSKTITAGAYTSLDISDVNVILFNSNAGNITINSFAGGVAGQVLQLSIIIHSANNITVTHGAVVAGQRIYLHAGADEILTAEYGGWTLVCDGTRWFDVSHAKHV